MKVHILQHVPHEGPAGLEPFLIRGNHQISCTRFFRGDSCPDPGGPDWIIVMGGPMGVSQVDEYPWMKEEKDFLTRCLTQEKKILGICLGAQLIADVLGAEVTENPRKEIGWFPVTTLPEVENSPLAGLLPEQFTAFHWHGETFSLPEGALRLFASEACVNQGFLYGNRVLALQFHLESTPESVRGLIEAGGTEIDGSRFTQSPEEILSWTDIYRELEQYTERIVSWFGKL